MDPLAPGRRRAPGNRPLPPPPTRGRVDRAAAVTAPTARRLAAALLAALVALAVLPLTLAAPATAAPAPPAVPTAPAPNPTPGRLPLPFAGAIATPAPAPGATATVSPAVHDLLVAGLGLPLGATPTLTGTPVGPTVVLDPPAPRQLPLGLPAGVPAPVFTTAHVVADPGADRVTVTASADAAAGPAADVRVIVDHAAGTSFTGPAAADLHADVRVGGLPVLGVKAELTGTLAYGGTGAVTATLVGHLPADVALSGAVTLLKGSALSLGTATGLQVAGGVAITAGASRFGATARGRLASADAWTLAVTPADPDTAGRFAPFAGLDLAAAATGSITAAAGTSRFDVTLPAPEGWSPLPGTKVHDATVEVSDGPAPAGSLLPAGVRPGDIWVVVRGGLGVADADGTGVLAVDLATGAARVATTATGPVSARGADGGPVTLTGAAFAADLRLDGGRLVGQVTGQGTVAGDDHSTLAVTLADDGTLAVAADPTPAPPAGADAPKGTVAISDGARRFLAERLGLPVRDDTLTGTADDTGRTVTVTLPAPGPLPVPLPAGVGPLAFGPTTVVADLGADTLTLTADATAGDGPAAHLAVTVAHASTTAAGPGADIRATLGITGVAVLGTTVDLTGTLAYDGTALSASLRGALARDAVLRQGTVTVAAGSAVTLGTVDGLTVDGTATIGTGATAVTVAVTGTIRDTRTWSLALAVRTAPSWSPVDGLTLTPTFAGSVSDDHGTVRVDLTASAPATWTPAPGVSLAVASVEVANTTPPAGVGCPDLADGDLWIDVAGDLSYTPGTGGSPLTAHADACVSPATRAFAVSTSVVTGGLAAVPQIGLDDVTLQASGGRGRPFAIGASAHLSAPSITAKQFTVGLRFATDGSFVGTVAVPNLADLGFDGSGTVYVSSRDVASFDPASIPGLTGVPFHLRAGLNVTVTYHLSPSVTDALKRFGLPLGDRTDFQADAALGPHGFAVAIQLGFGTGTAGAKVLDTGGSSPVRLYLNDVSVGFELSSASQSLSLSAGGTLTVGALSSQTGPSSVALRAAITVDIAKLAFNASFSLTGSCGAAACPWDDAFGVPGLRVGALGGGFGITFETAVPTPSVAISADDVSLPPTSPVARALGIQPGAAFTVNLNVSATSPLLEVGVSGSPALKPLQVVSNDQATIDRLRIDAARVVLAPFGGTTAAGQAVDPGASVLFQAVIGGVPVHAHASVNLATLTLDGTFAADGFAVGSLTLDATRLHLHIEPTAFDFAFTGGFTDRVSRASIRATVHLSASLTQAGGAVQLTVVGGLPGYIAVNGDLAGSVSVSGAGASFAASGSGTLIVGNRNLGAVSISYTYDGGLLWQQLNQDAAAVAQAFRDVYGWTSDQVNATLASLRFTDVQKINALFNAFPTASVVNSLASFFQGSGAYWLSTSNGSSFPMYADVSGASQSANAPVLSYMWNGGTNQEWFVVPTDGGYAELVNRNSGQCLSAGYNWTQRGAPLVQYPCFGGANQQWYLGVYPGAANLDGQSRVLTNRATGFVADVTGGDPSSGVALEVWSYNGGWNQSFRFTKVPLF